MVLRWAHPLVAGVIRVYRELQVLVGIEDADVVRRFVGTAFPAYDCPYVFYHARGPLINFEFSN